MSQKIYFDESGFTGNNLLDSNQKFFSYASVATDDQETKDLAERVAAKYHIQGGELKGSKLVKFHRGRKAIDEIFDHLGERFKVSISDKKFALAGKFHEYIFEPSFSEVNSLFYGIGFHRFIANILYAEFTARSAGAEQIFEEFERLMRTNDEAGLQGILSASVRIDRSPLLGQIREFVQYQAHEIRTELATIEGVGAGKWILDLTGTALFTLLANWGTHYEELTAVCDSSKPLQDDQTLFGGMIGRNEQVSIEGFGGGAHPITFNLSGPILFADSAISHGIQIADVVAAAAVYAFSGNGDEFAEEWRRRILRNGLYGSVLPDLEEIDSEGLSAQLNALVLMELHARAKNKQSLVEGMAELVQLLAWRLLEEPLAPVHDSDRSDFALKLPSVALS